MEKAPTRVTEPSGAVLDRLCARCHEDKGVDRLSFVTTIRHLRTGPGLRNQVFAARRSPSSRADPLPQHPAGVRSCRDRLRLRHCAAGR
jgi:hypothetical protein